MPFLIPTLQDLAERTALGFRTWLKGSDAKLWPNNVAVSAKVMSGAVWEAFGFLGQIADVAFVHRCPGWALDWHGREYEMPRKAASYAGGTVTVYGTAGTIVAAGVVLLRVDGERVVTTAPVIASPTGVDVAVVAALAGALGNALPGVAFEPEVRIAGITSIEVSDDGIGGGADPEGDESYRQRLLFRKQFVPHGGSASDYVRWAREVPGVTRVFVDPVTLDNGRTTVAVYPLFDDTRVNGIPLTSDLNAVAHHIEDLRPAGARVQILAATPLAVNIDVDNLSPFTSAIDAAVRAEIADLFRRDSRVATLTEPFVFSKSRIAEAVSVAAGERSHDLVAPSSNITVTAGSIPVPGTITTSP